MTLTLRQRLTRLGAAATIAAVALLGTAAPASAEKYGDGTWKPSHDLTDQVIPICKGPGAVADWLYYNFSDHGRDIKKFLDDNYSALEKIVRGQSSILTTPALLAKVVVQIPVYAVNDALFHLPPTTLSLATGCGIIGKFGINPFSILR